MVRRRVAAGALALVAGAALAACTEGGSDQAANDPAPTTSTTDPTWSAPGTAIMDGFVVPDGAALLGAPVTAPLEYLYDGEPVRQPDLTRAYLAVTGDPFAVFDDLVAQARAAGADMPGSVAACSWNVPRAPGDADPGVRPVAGPEPEEEVTGARCEAWVGTEREDLRLVLDVDVERPAVLVVESGGDPGSTSGRYGMAEQARGNRRANLGDSEEARAREPESFLPTDDPVPSGSADRLPAAPTELEDTESGDPVLWSRGCRAQRDADDLVVPEGARVLARPPATGLYPDRGDQAVLAVDDAEAALTDLHEQAGGEAATAAGDSGFYGDPPAQVELEDGTLVWSVTFGTGAGGDACELIASPDGTTVLMTVARG